MIAILTEERWNLSDIFICISLMVKDVEPLFLYLLAVCTSFENCLFNSFAHLLIWGVWLFVNQLQEGRRSTYVWEGRRFSSGLVLAAELVISISLLYPLKS
jgi:hypothetical protein